MKATIRTFNILSESSSASPASKKLGIEPEENDNQLAV
jgi:hypothetical protein